MSVYHDGEADILDIKTGKRIKTLRISPYRLLSVEAKHIKFDISGNYICYTGHNNYGGAIWEARTGKRVCHIKGHGGELSSVIIDAERKTAVSVFGSIRQWDLENGKCIRTIKGRRMQGDQCGLDEEGVRLAVKVGENIEIWNLQTGEQERALVEKGHIYNLDTRTKGGHSKKTVVLTEYPVGDFSLRDPFSGDKIKQFDFRHEQIDIGSLTFQVRGEHLINVDQRIQIRIRNLNTQHGVKMINAGTDWIVYTKDGYFDSSRHGGALVAMAKDLKTFGMDQFAVRNNRPDMILTDMALGDEDMVAHFYSQYRKRIKRMGFLEEELSFDLHVPEVDILKAGQDGKFVDLECALNDDRYPLKRYNIHINDVPLFGSIGKQLTGSHVRIKERVELTGGRNKIEVTCINEKGAESYRALRTIDYDEETPGDLYYIGFGVSSYRNPELDLKYAKKDAMDLAGLFSEMKGAFRNVHVRTFVNGQVNKGSLKKAGEFIKQAKVEDTLVLFIAGHGMHAPGEGSTYYYLAHESSFDNLPATALSYDAFEDFLIEAAPRRKLFLMDACESGEVEKIRQDRYFTMAGARGFIPRTTRSLIVMQRERKHPAMDVPSGFNRYIYNDLIRRSGAVVFSSSKGYEFSYESDSLENGFFTEGILRALRAETADKDSSQYVSVEELRDYVVSEVSESSGNLQHPTIDRDNIYQRIEFPVLPANR